MNKKELSQILAGTKREIILQMAELLSDKYTILELKKPEKTMVMLQVKESAKNNDFYLGELLASHCVVEIEGIQGAAVQIGDDFDKVRGSAVIDAAHTGNLPEYEELERQLLECRKEQEAVRLKEAAIHRNTKVNFRILEDNHESEA